MPEEDFYGAEEDAPETTPDAPKPKGEGEEGDDNTALVPTGILPEGCKVGDTYTVKVVGKYEDEAEISVQSKKKSEPEEETSDQRMEAMAF